MEDSANRIKFTNLTLALLLSKAFERIYDKKDTSSNINVIQYTNSKIISFFSFNVTHRTATTHKHTKFEMKNEKRAIEGYKGW